MLLLWLVPIESNVSYTSRSEIAVIFTFPRFWKQILHFNFLEWKVKKKIAPVFLSLEMYLFFLIRGRVCAGFHSRASVRCACTLFRKKTYMSEEKNHNFYIPSDTWFVLKMQLAYVVVTLKCWITAGLVDLLLFFILMASFLLALVIGCFLFSFFV